MKIKLLFLFAVLGLQACASTAPTVETYSAYRIYFVPNDYTLSQVRDAVVNAVKADNENASVVNAFPPSPLPDKPGRFVMKESQFGPFSMQFPQMPGATVSIQSNKNVGSAESMNWMVGIYPYERGYSVQMVMVARYRRGVSNPFNPVELGASLGRELAYKQSGGIEKRIEHWFESLVNKVESGVHMTLVDAYPDQNI